MFEGFEQRHIQTSGTTINLVKRGDGPPLLLLHGYPQTHTMWHKVSPLSGPRLHRGRSGRF